MAHFNKGTVRERASAEVYRGWAVSSRLDISSQAAAEKLLAADTYEIKVYSDSAVVYRFDTATGDSNSLNDDLVIPANQEKTIPVPRDLGDTIYFHVKQQTSAVTKYLRLVEV